VSLRNIVRQGENGHSIAGMQVDARKDRNAKRDQYDRGDRDGRTASIPVADEPRGLDRRMYP
jgi:hypothetical protein